MINRRLAMALLGACTTAALAFPPAAPKGPEIQAYFTIAPSVSNVPAITFPTGNAGARICVEVCAFDLTQCLFAPGLGAPVATAPTFGNVTGLPGSLCLRTEGCAPFWWHVIDTALDNGRTVDFTLCVTFTYGSGTSVARTCTTIQMGQISRFLAVRDPDPDACCRPETCQTFTFDAAAATLWGDA